jgi:hypothetical protein
VGPPLECQEGARFEGNYPRGSWRECTALTEKQQCNPTLYGQLSWALEKTRACENGGKVGRVWLGGNPRAYQVPVGTQFPPYYIESAWASLVQLGRLAADVHVRRLSFTLSPQHHPSQKRERMPPGGERLKGARIGHDSKIGPRSLVFRRARFGN